MLQGGMKEGRAEKERPKKKTFELGQTATADRLAADMAFAFRYYATCPTNIYTMAVFDTTAHAKDPLSLTVICLAAERRRAN